MARALEIDWHTADRIRRGVHVLQQPAAQLPRCPGCGGLVEVEPCGVCAARAYPGKGGVNCEE